MLFHYFSSLNAFLPKVAFVSGMLRDYKPAGYIAVVLNSKAIKEPSDTLLLCPSQLIWDRKGGRESGQKLCPGIESLHLSETSLIL